MWDLLKRCGGCFGCLAHCPIYGQGREMSILSQCISFLAQWAKRGVPTARINPSANQGVLAKILRWFDVGSELPRLGSWLCVVSLWWMRTWRRFGDFGPPEVFWPENQKGKLSLTYGNCHHREHDGRWLKGYVRLITKNADQFMTTWWHEKVVIVRL